MGLHNPLIIRPAISGEGYLTLTSHKINHNPLCSEAMILDKQAMAWQLFAKGGIGFLPPDRRCRPLKPTLLFWVKRHVRKRWDIFFKKNCSPSKKNGAIRKHEKYHVNGTKNIDLRFSVGVFSQYLLQPWTSKCVIWNTPRVLFWGVALILQGWPKLDLQGTCAKVPYKSLFAL